MQSSLKRYELFGWDYEQRNPITDEEIAWYLSFVEKSGGPVLELACGTGRLLTTIAENGYDIEGIDLSPAMLNLAAARITGLSPEAASHIRLHNQDIACFFLERHYGLVIIADGSFGVLATKEQQLACLNNIQHHLRPNGILLVTVRRFDPSWFPDGRQIIDWSEPVRSPIDSSLVTRRGEIHLVDNNTRLQGVFHYKITHDDSTEIIEESPFESPVMSVSDYISLFTETGFRSQVYTDYREKPDNGVHPVLCFVCKKTNIRG